MGQLILKQSTFHGVQRAVVLYYKRKPFYNKTIGFHTAIAIDIITRNNNITLCNLVIIYL